jgi:hypothetical protein
MVTVVDIPLYEPLIMGNPFYLIVIMGMGALIILGLVAFKTEVYDIMQPVWGFRAAASSGKPQMLIQGMNGKMWLETVDHVANIFRSLTLPLMWIITVPVAGQMGKVNTSIVSDDWNIIHNIDIDYAIVEIVHNWNAREDTKPEGEREYIHNFDTFNYHLMSGNLIEMYPQGVTLPPFRVVDMHEIKNYLPKWDAAHHAGYINQEVANRRKDEDKKGTELIKYAVVAAACVGIVFVLGYIMITNARPMNCG